MKIIETFSISFQAPDRQASKSVKLPNNLQQTNEGAAFSKLLQATSSEHQETHATQQHEEFLGNVEEVLKAIQEFPKDSLLPEETAILSMILQMLAQPINNLNVQQHGKQQLLSLFQQVEQEMNKLFPFSATIPFDGNSLFVGVKENNPFSQQLNDTGQATSQLNNLFQLLEGGQQSTEKPLGFFQQPESFNKLLNQLNNLLEEFAEVVDREQMNQQTLKVESSVPLTGSSITSGIGSELILSNAGSSNRKMEPFSDQMNSQVTTVHSVQDVQGGQGAQKTETTNPQTSTVRFTHLMEDLSEIFKGTFRLNSNLEGTQLRVNIFPEHLGHLDIRLTTADGKVTAQIFTASLSTKEALDTQIQQLRNALIQQGISVEKIEITHQTSQQSYGQQHAHSEQRFSQQQQRQGVSVKNGNAYHTMEEEAAKDAQHLSDGSVQVNYTI